MQTAHLASVCSAPTANLNTSTLAWDARLGAGCSAMAVRRTKAERDRLLAHDELAWDVGTDASYLDEDERAYRQVDLPRDSLEPPAPVWPVPRFQR